MTNPAADHGLVFTVEPTPAELATTRLPPPSDPWLARRMHAFGASEVPALLVALGLRAPESVPRYIADNAKPIRTRLGTYPRLVLEKAGVRKPLSAGDAARIGQAREVELLHAWAATLTDADALDAASVAHSSSVPRWLWPVVDRRCHRLAVSLDAWCLDVVGEQVIVELKCGRVSHEVCPWHWATQTQAQMAATDAGLAVVVCGQGWSRSLDSYGPIDPWPVERDEHAIAELREACERGWQMVKDVQAKTEDAT